MIHDGSGGNHKVQLIDRHGGNDFSVACSGILVGGTLQIKVKAVIKDNALSPLQIQLRSVLLFDLTAGEIVIIIVGKITLQNDLLPALNERITDKGNKQKA